MIGQSISHYHILDKIGAGGMGEVYRAHDEQLDRDVALKILRAGMLADDEARKHFRKEALALAKLNHPNVETVYEFGTQDGVDFLAMELIAGSSLSRKLKEGPLPEKDIARLGTQFLQGLAAAHEQGVLHRDLKPGNLMITPDGRLKILDFGLAKLLHPAQDLDVTRSITRETESISGTVPYMSPEQLRGEPPDAKGDIYAAGAVLYEMTTGQRPFPQTQGPQLIGAILHQAPAPPRSLNPRASPGLERVILKALEKDPSQRFQSSREFLGALEGLSASEATAVEQGRPSKQIIAAAAGAISIVLLTGLVFGLNLGRLRGRLLPRYSPKNTNAGLLSGAIRARRSVAVLGFKNLSGRQDEAWLSTALSEMLTTELAVGEQLHTIPGENVAQMRINLSLPDAESYGKETLSRIRSNLGAEDVVVGSYLALGNGQVRVDLRLQDTVAGETLASVAESGREAEVSDLVTDAGTKLREKLGAAAVSVEEAGEVRAALPSNPEAARLYSEGLARLRLFDALKARDLLAESTRLEPGFAMAHSSLAAAWSALGYDVKAGEEAKKAFDLSANLSHEERLLTEARYREVTKDWNKAIEIYRTLFQFFPDNLDHGLHLALAQDSAGKSADALATVQELRKLPAPACDDPRIDVAEAAAAGSLSDFQRAQRAAARAAEKGRADGARLVVARARLMECWVYEQGGQFKQAIASCLSAKDIYSAAGDRNNMAWALNNLANVAFNEGDYASAKKTFEEALLIFRQVGNKNYTAGALGNLANVLQAQGDLDGARKMHEQSLALYRAIGNIADAAIEMVNIASILVSRGDLPDARTMSDQALAISRKIGDKATTDLALLSLGLTLFAEGDLPGARKNLTEGLATAEASGDKHVTSYFLAASGQILEVEAHLAAAQEKHEEALALRTELGEKVAIAESHLDLAAVSLDLGQPAEAEKLAERALGELSGQNAPDDEASAQLSLARALLAQGKLAEAQKAMERARTFSAATENRETRLRVEINSARIQAVAGRAAVRAQAISTIERALAEATKTRMVQDEFEARLALGEIQMKSSNPDAARADLVVLEKDAAAKGFLLIARKAQAAAGR
jgi:eukaryotic-like serine/threonine-protein kinase